MATMKFSRRGIARMRMPAISEISGVRLKVMFIFIYLVEREETDVRGVSIIAIVIAIPLFLLVPFLLMGGVPALLLFFPALRTALLRRGWGGHPNVFVSPLRRLRTRGARSI